MSAGFSENHPGVQLSQPYIFEETDGKEKAASRVAGVSLSLSSSHLVARASPARILGRRRHMPSARRQFARVLDDAESVQESIKARSDGFYLAHHYADCRLFRRSDQRDKQAIQSRPKYKKPGEHEQ